MTGKDKVRYTLADVDLLEATYQNSPRLSPDQNQKLADSMGYTNKQIHRWFACRRARDENMIPQLHFTPEEREQLEAVYRTKQKPSKTEREKIAKRMNIAEVNRVHNWFHSRRYPVQNTPPNFRFSRQQRALLVSNYLKNKQPTGQEYQKIAVEVGASKAQISRWFNVRRFQMNRSGRSDAEEEAVLANYQESHKNYAQHIGATVISPTTSKILEDAFEINPHPTSEELQNLHEKTELEMDRITIWFDRKNFGIEKRTHYEKLKSETQKLSILKESYEKNKYMTGKQLNELADQLDMRRMRVHDWFKERRSLDKEYRPDFFIDKTARKKNPDQLFVLNEAYKKNKILKGKDAAELAVRVNLTITQLQSWFEVKRHNDKEYERKKFPFTIDQVRIMKDLLEKNPWPSSEEKRKEGKKVGLTLAQVTSWFTKNRRKSDCGSNPRFLTSEQKDILRLAYDENPNPDVARREELANLLDTPTNRVTKKRVGDWFSDARLRQQGKRRVPLWTVKGESQSKKEDMDVKIKVESMDTELDDKSQIKLH